MRGGYFVGIENLAEQLVAWLNEKRQTAGADGFVVGLSGGIDSAVVAALCKRACPDNVLGLIMPCFSNPQDALDAQLVAETLGVPFRRVVLDEVFLRLLKELGNEEYDPEKRDLPVANIKPRLRMTAQYFYASRYNYLVVGTGNLSEIMVGYFTKYGDGGADLLPLANLVKRDVKALAFCLGVPQKIIDKEPSAGLWIGQNDREEMGFSYEDLDCYLLNGEGSEDVKKKIRTLIAKSQHKRELPLKPPF